MTEPIQWWVSHKPRLRTFREDLVLSRAQLEVDRLLASLRTLHLSSGASVTKGVASILDPSPGRTLEDQALTNSLERTSELWEETLDLLKILQSLSSRPP